MLVRLFDCGWCVLRAVVCWLSIVVWLFVVAPCVLALVRYSCVFVGWRALACVGGCLRLSVVC